jgi:ribosome-associated translation inhibitor RaiA
MATNLLHLIKYFKNWTSLDLKSSCPIVIIKERQEVSMDESLKPKIDLQNLSPEVKSYILQALMEFEPFTTPQTTVAVIAKDPIGLLSFDTEEPNEHGFGELPKKSKLRKMFRISITLTEDGGSLTAEGLHEDIYEAIKMAKDKLLVILNQIQDDIISNSDRHQQIKHALAAGGEVH